LFVATYGLCVIWGALIHFFESLAETKADEIEMTVKYFPHMVGNSIFAPMAGLFNMMVHIRPKYLKWKENNPHNTNLRDFWRSLFVLESARRRAYDTGFRLHAKQSSS